MRPRSILNWVGLPTLVAATAGLAPPGLPLLFNGSPSEPEGFYLRRPVTPAVGRLIAFPVPPAGRPYARAHLPMATRTILKTVVAAQGDRVCVVKGMLSVEGRVLGPIRRLDRQGRALPQWRGCRPMGPGEYFVFSDRIPTSFDSRYYGPIQRGAVLGVYTRLRGLGGAPGGRKS